MLHPPSILIASLLLLGQADAAPLPQTNEAQALDVASFDEQIKATHPSPFDVHSEEEWDAAVATLKASAAGLTPDQFFLGLLRLAAMLEDGHSSVSAPASFRQTAYPIGFAFFGDELFVTCAAAPYAAAVGQRVLGFGEASIERVMQDLTPLGCGDNRRAARERLTSLMRHGALYRALGWCAAGGASLLVAQADGSELRVPLDGPTSAAIRGPLPPHGPAPTGWLSAAYLRPAPLWQQNLGQAWWFEYLEEEGCLYVGFNSVTDQPGQTLAEFWKELFSMIEVDGIERLLIDMRHNAGGDGYKNQVLIHSLIRSELVNRPGRLFVLSGPRTFSAAVMGISDLESQTWALFVGEPSGAGPSHYGDATTLTLPGTDMRVRCSTVYHQFTDGRDKRRWIEPDLRAELRFQDFSEGHDPALAAALLYDEDDAGNFASWPPNAHWMRPSQERVLARGARQK